MVYFFAILLGVGLYSAYVQHEESKTHHPYVDHSVYEEIKK